MWIYQRLWYTPKREKVFKERSPRPKRSHLNSTKMYRISRQLTIKACLIKLLPKQDFFLYLSFDCGYIYIVLWYILQLIQWVYIILRDQSWVSNLFACISESFQDKQSTRVTREHWGHDHLAKGHGREKMSPELEEWTLRSLTVPLLCSNLWRTYVIYLSQIHMHNSTYMVSLMCL